MASGEEGRGGGTRARHGEARVVEDEVNLLMVVSEGESDGSPLDVS